jgi:hypothetical protein
MKLTKLIGDLKKSPLFYMFISSRELFHTNFWYWLKELNAVEMLKLFSDQELIINKDTIFSREHRQGKKEKKAIIDLAIHHQKKPVIVIENKIKDFPAQSQLSRIQESFNDDTIKFILVTLFWQNDLKFDGWKTITYQNLSERIIPENFVSNETDPLKKVYFLNLIQDYKSFTAKLAEIAQDLSVNQEYDFAKSHKGELFQILNEAKLWEGYQKLRASHLIQCFSSNGYYNDLFAKIPINLGYSVNNKKATLDFFTIHEVKSVKYTIGVQIEDNQFRSYVNGNNGNQFADNLLEKNLFFDAAYVSKKKREPFLQYGKHFKYQYTEIEQQSFEDLFQKINAKLSEILQFKEEIIACIPN